MMKSSTTTLPGYSPRLEPEAAQRSNGADSPLGYERETLHAAAQTIREHLKPYGENGNLVLSLFHKLSLGSVSCHTIFGTKPVSEHIVGLSDNFCKENPTCVTRNELSAWEQVSEQAGLVSSYLILRQGRQMHAALEAGSLLIYNLNNVRDTFARHCDRFQEKLGPSATAETVIEHLHSALDINSILNNDHELKGILVGYGKKSAAAFARIMELAQSAGLTLPGSGLNVRDQLATIDLPSDFPLEEYITLNLALGSTVRSAFANAVGFRVLDDDYESHDLLRGYAATTESLKELSKEQIVPYIAIARWCGMLT